MIVAVIARESGRCSIRGRSRLKRLCVCRGACDYWMPAFAGMTAELDVPLQSRVDPFGELFADSSRGTMFGNRGGRFHTDDQKLTKRRWASRQWICCVLDFKNRQRDVWGRYYTELFFLDEVTALATGHRPCFECRRRNAEAFAGYWQRTHRLLRRPRADEMDLVLHAERLDGRVKRLHRRKLDDLPDGAMVALEAGAFAVNGASLLRWTPKGYDNRQRRPGDVAVDVLTPPAILSVLAAGYRPQWHPSAED